MRNWLIGVYLVEYEQLGADRALYGTKLYKTLAEELNAKKIKGLSFTNLHLFKQFYQTYSQIVQTASDQFKLPQNVIQNETELKALIDAEQAKKHF